MKVSSPRKGTELDPRVFASWQEEVNRAIRNLGFVRAVSATVQNDFGSIPAHGQLSVLVTVEGARPGGAVLVSITGSFVDGVTFDGRVTGDDEVRIRANNVTAGAIDPDNKNFAVMVFNL